MVLSSLLRRRSDDDVEPAPFDIGEIATILKNERRRAVIDHIDVLGEVDLGTLADIISADEQDVPIGEADTKSRKTVYVALHQTHLDKLADLDIVEAPDRGSGMIRPGPAFDDAVRVLEAIRTAQRGERP